MRRALTFGTVMAVAMCTLVLTTAGPASAFATVRCNNTTLSGPIYDNVEVSPGAFCNLVGATVYGSVKVGAGAALLLSNSTVVSQVTADRPREIDIFSSTVQGSVTITGLGSPANSEFNGNKAMICGSTIYGSLTYSYSQPVSVFEAGTGESDFFIPNQEFFLQAQCPVPPPATNTIYGSVILLNNKGNWDISGNSISGSVRATVNKGSGSVYFDTILGSLFCSSNIPPVTAFGNTFSGSSTCTAPPP